MRALPAGIKDAVWLETPARVRALIIRSAAADSDTKVKERRAPFSTFRPADRIAQPAEAERPQLLELLQAALQRRARGSAASAAHGQWPLRGGQLGHPGSAAGVASN